MVDAIDVNVEELRIVVAADAGGKTDDNSNQKKVYRCVEAPERYAWLHSLPRFIPHARNRFLRHWLVAKIQAPR